MESYIKAADSADGENGPESTAEKAGEPAIDETSVPKKSNQKNNP